MTEMPQPEKGKEKEITDLAFTDQDRADLEEFLIDYEWRRSSDYGHQPPQQQPQQQAGPDYYRLFWWTAALLANTAAWVLAWWIFNNWFLY